MVAAKSYSISQILADIAALRGRLGSLRANTSWSSSPNVNNTVTGTGFANLGPTWVVTANDPQVGTVYHFRIAGHGTQGSTAQGIGHELFVNGSGLGQAGWPSSFGPASLGFNWVIEGDFVIRSTGPTGSFVSQMTATVNQSNISAVGGTTGAVTIDTTSTITMVVQAGWFANVGAPTITCDYGYLERVHN